MKDYRPPYGSAVIASVAVLALYVLTLAPTTSFWDASEYIATAHILGIPHPPGNALFVVLGRAWSVLLAPFGLPVAVRINLFAAMGTAIACGFLFLVAHRVLRGLASDAPRWVVIAGAGAATLLAATAFTVWNQSNVNEKVYTLSVMIIAAVSWLTVLWKDRRHEAGSARYLLVAVYLMVLGSTNHLMSLLPAPALLLLVLLVEPRMLLRKALWTRGVLLVLLGLSFNIFLPIRAAENPVINEGHPACEEWQGAAVAVFTVGRAGCPALAFNLTRGQYGKPSVAERQAPTGHQLLNYFQYFDWQWARGLDPSELPGNGRIPVTLLFVALGLAGLAAIRRADREIFVYLGALTVTLTLGLVLYLNFKYGFTLAPEEVDRARREVRERDYFFIGSFLFWGMLAGIGLTWCAALLARRVSHGRRWLLVAPVLLVATLPLFLNWKWASRADDYAARDWAYNLLMSVEPYGVLFTQGDNDTFPLWYLQEVEEIRKDVTVIVVQYLNTDWYPKQLQELTHPGNQRPFRSEDAAGIYPSSPPPPSRPVLSISPGDMDRMQGGRTGQDYTIPLGDVAISYPAGIYLGRAERLALAIIRDSIEERPIYFAATGGLAESLGMRDWTVLQGLASRLVLRDEAARPGDLSRVPIAPGLGGGWIDLERSLVLAEEVFLYRGLRDRDIWAERASLNIPLQFYLLNLRMADALSAMGGEQEAVASLLRDADAFLETARGGRLGTPN